ncbi:hypothetical protein M378DRAFT_154776, partial [Amanita muscaria Koide BX008]
MTTGKAKVDGERAERKQFDVLLIKKKSKHNNGNSTGLPHAYQAWDNSQERNFLECVFMT